MPKLWVVESRIWKGGGGFGGGGERFFWRWVGERKFGKISQFCRM